MKLLRDQILVRPIKNEAEMKTASGIVVPGKENPFEEGEVVSVGQNGGRAMDGSPIPSSLVVGDKVLYARGTGADFTLDGEPGLKLMSEQHLIAITRRKPGVPFR